eukprot:TRINITY_DN7267_c0_g1_i5.p1 TRINITY_DN7267_c0_g1~~TRINITY_DN7267_c0_g1_i5.p1  ORF type:complete len:206 (-),score=10.75 TRINITY_DN7267_c0_g1_i5:75-662(-)
MDDGLWIQGLDRNKHEKYCHADRTFQYDIATVTLSLTLNFDHQDLKPICLPVRVDSFVTKENMVAGWGRTGTSEDISLKLQRVFLKTLSNKECKKHTNTDPRFFLCTPHREGRGACGGDAGGPLAFQKRKYFIQSGIISHSLGSGVVMNGVSTVACADMASRDSYDVYVKPYQFMDWIEDRNKGGLSGTLCRRPR